MEEIKPQSKKATFTFGRFNPITRGHKKLIDSVVSHAKETGGDHHVFLSQTQDTKKNPLSFTQKLELAKKIFPRVNFHEEKTVKTVIDAMNHLSKMGYEKLTMMTGSDRQQEFNNLLNKYKPEGTSIDVQSVGERDPESGDVKGISGTKMREFAKNKKYRDFRKGAANPDHAREMYHAVRKGMRVENFEEHFKALFLVGGPGSGKDFIISTLLGEASIKEIPLDKIIGAVNQGEELSELNNYPSLIVNGNADNYEKVIVSQRILESMGYDTAMIYVYTTDEESKLRNDQRIARQVKTFTEEVRYEKYNNSVKNLHDFASCFSESFYIFDNSFDFVSVGAVRRQEILGWLNELGTHVGQFFETVATKESSKIWLMEKEVPDAPGPKFGSATNNVYQMHPKYGKKRKSPPKKEGAKPLGDFGDKNIGGTPSLSGFGGMFSEAKNKIKHQWHVVTAQHVNGYPMTWKSRSAARAQVIFDNARRNGGGDEIVPGSVTWTKPKKISEQKQISLKKKKEDKKQASPPYDSYRSEMGMVPSGGEGLVSTMSEGEKSFGQLRKNLSAVLHNVDKE